MRVKCCACQLLLSPYVTNVTLGQLRNLKCDTCPNKAFKPFEDGVAQLALDFSVSSVTFVKLNTLHCVVLTNFCDGRTDRWCQNSYIKQNLTKHQL